MSSLLRMPSQKLSVYFIIYSTVKLSRYLKRIRTVCELNALITIRNADSSLNFSEDCATSSTSSFFSPSTIDQIAFLQARSHR